MKELVQNDQEAPQTEAFSKPSVPSASSDASLETVEPERERPGLRNPRTFGQS